MLAKNTNTVNIPDKMNVLIHHHLIQNHHCCMRKTNSKQNREAKAQIVVSHSSETELVLAVVELRVSRKLVAALGFRRTGGARAQV